MVTVAVLVLCCIGCFMLGTRKGRCGGKPSETDTDRIPEEILQGVVSMEIYDESGNKIACASGFVITGPKRLVTCRHVLKDMEYAICTTETGETFRAATISESDSESDIAMLLLPDDCEVQPLKAASQPLYRGEGVIAIGSQFGMQNVVTRGNVSMVKDTYILFTAPVNAGSSGGVLLNDAYEVCGIVRGTYNEGQNINLAVPIGVAEAMLSEANE